MNTENETGSWTPVAILLILLLARFILKNQSIRRTFQMQKLKLKRAFGLRDEERYKMKAGDGSNQAYKRQG